MAGYRNIPKKTIQSTISQLSDASDVAIKDQQRSINI